MKEVFKHIPTHPQYLISNYGKVMNLKSNLILKPSINNGYFQVVLCTSGAQRTFKVHQLVAMGFLGYIPCGHNVVVNHKDLNKQNNHVSNLELISNRENSNRKHLPSKSIYTGVSWSKNAKKWQATIRIDGALKHIGYFTDETAASNAYQNALNEI